MFYSIGTVSKWKQLFLLPALLIPLIGGSSTANAISIDSSWQKSSTRSSVTTTAKTTSGSKINTINDSYILSSLRGHGYADGEYANGSKFLTGRKSDESTYQYETSSTFSIGDYLYLGMWADNTSARVGDSASNVSIDLYYDDPSEIIATINANADSLASGQPSTIYENFPTSINDNLALEFNSAYVYSPTENSSSYQTANASNDSDNQKLSLNAGSITVNDESNQYKNYIAIFKIVSADTTPPAAPTVSGVDGTLFNSSVTPNFSCSEGSLSTSGLSGWSNNSEISADGTYSLSGTCTDTAGNVSTQTTVGFTIDTIAPAAPTVSGVDGTLFNSSVTPNFSCSEGSLSTSGLSGWSNNSEISADGTYSLSGTCTDTAGNVSTQTTVGFTIDTIAPAAPTVSGVDGTLFNSSVTPNFSCSEGSLSTSGLSGWSNNSEISADGTYSLSGTCTDTAGNVSTQTTVGFTIDTIAPAAPTVSGVDGTLFNSSVTPNFSCSEGSLSTSGLSGWSNNSEISADGTYSLSGTCTDTAGNVSTQTTVDFTIDTIAPAAPTVSGVDGTLFNSSVTPNFSCSEGSLSTSGLSGWSNNSEISADGTYSLSGTCTDTAGNVSTQTTVGFTIDTIAPAAPTVSGVDGTLFNSSVTPNFSCSEGSLSTSGLSGWSNNSEISADGTYSLSGTCTDTAGNVSTQTTVDFTIDTIAPAAPTVSGVDGTLFNSSVTPNFSCSEGSLSTSGLSGWSNNSEISADGTYSLSGTCTDTAGNVSTQTTVGFTIDTIAPAAPTVSGVDGTLFNSSVTPNFSCSEGSLSTSGLSGWSNNSEISADGTYSLSGTCTDTAGNVSTQTTVGFTIDTIAPADYSVAFDDDSINNTEATSISFSFSDAEVDASFSYSINDSDDTTDPITGSGVIDASDNQITAIDVSSLSDGDLTLTVSLTDPAGNVGADETNTVVKDTAAPTGYSVAFDDDNDLINSDEQSDVSFSFSDAEVDTSFSYSINDSDDTTDPVTGSGVIDASDNQITAIDVSSLSDGDLTLTVSLTDPAGNVGADETNTVVKDTAAPTGYSVAFDDDNDLINSDEQSDVSFSFSGAEVDASFSYSINDSDDTTDPITGSGSITASDNQITGIDLSSLSDGDLTLTVSLTDPAGNVGDDQTNTALKDTAAPTGYSVAFDDDSINNTEATSISFSFSDAEVDASYSYSIDDSDDTTNPITGSGSITASDNQITGIDLSSLSDGDLTLTVSLTDPAGNTGADETNTALKDTAAPTGYSVAFDDDLINNTEATSISFSFSDAEVGASYSYSIDDSDDTTNPITGSGSITASDNQITGIDLSSLSDGDLTLTVSLTDPAGNVGDDQTNTALKDTAAPTGYSVAFDDDLINNTEATSISFSFSDAEVGAAYSYSINDNDSSNDDTVSPITGSGSITASDNQITGIDLSSLSDGDLTLTVSLTDPAGNTGADETNTALKDTAPPTDYSVAFDDDNDLINSDEQSGVSFSFADAEVDATYSYFISDSNNTSTSTITGSISASDQQITAIDVSSLSDGDLTLTVSLTDPAGNVGADVTDNLVKDTTAPTGYSASFDDPDDLINTTEQSDLSFSFADAEVDASYSYSIDDSDDTTNPITGSGSITASDNQITGIDLSSLSDGDLTLTVSLTDPAGNVGDDQTNTALKDTAAPTGYSVAFDDDLINNTEATSISFSFSDAEVGAAYSYSINDNDSSNDDTVSPITGSGSITASDNQITGIDLSSLSDGDLTLTVSLTDPAGNTGADETNTALKDTAPPTDYSVAFDDDNDLINSDEQSGVSFSFADAEVDASFSYSINDSDDTTDPVTGSGVIDASDNQITGIDLSSLSDGDLTLTVSLTDPAGNTGADVTDNLVKDTTAPTITGSVLATDNSYVDLTFSKPSYTNANATGALQVSDFKISNFSAENAENSDLISVTIDAITQTDNDDQTLATALTGGELWFVCGSIPMEPTKTPTLTTQLPGRNLKRSSSDCYEYL